MNGQFRHLLLPLAIAVCGFAPTALAQNANKEAGPRPVARLVSSGPINPVPKRITTSATRATSPTLDQANAIERRAFEQTNQIRLQNGLAALTWDADVCRLAREHSANMSREGYFSHTTPGGKRLRDRVRNVGIAQYRVVAENIAYNQGYDDPGAFAVERWMLSPKHRANILSPEFQSMAIGSFVGPDGAVYLTQTFITR